MLVPPADIAHSVSNGDPTSRNNSTHLFYELHGLLPPDSPDGADLLVVEQDAVKLVRSVQHLRTKGRRDELRRGGEIVYHG